MAEDNKDSQPNTTDATNPNEGSNALETLEDKDTEVTATPDGKGSDAPKAKGKAGIGNKLSGLASGLNVYLLGFILLVVVALIIAYIAINTGSKQQQQLETIETEELTQEAIDNLTSNEATVGDPKQLLTVESNAVFNGKVLVRDGLDVAGPIKVGGELNLPGITVSGTSQFDQVQVNSLSIAGDTSVQGLLSVENNLSVAGSASFGGTVSAPSIVLDAIQLNGDLTFNRHIDAGGGTPGVSRGAGVGGSGSVTISGTDTAGTVTINVGSGAGAGTLAAVSFAAGYTGNPHVVITPVAGVGSASVTSGTFYLSSRSSSGFTIASTTPVSAGSISFDYIVID